MNSNDPLDPLKWLAQQEVDSTRTQRMTKGAIARLNVPRSSRVRTGALMFVIASVALVMGGVLLQIRERRQLELPFTTLTHHETTSMRLGAHRVEMDANTTLTKAEGPNVKLNLAVGTIRCWVEPLKNDSFSVVTPEAVVEVVGTQFSVSRSGECTTVEVFEGKVRVTSKAGVSTLLEPAAKQQFCAPSKSSSVEGEAEIAEALKLIASRTDLQRTRHLLRTYLDSNPEGVFVEEALFYLWKLESSSNASKASELGEAFIRRFPDSARALTIMKWRGDKASDQNSHPATDSE